MHDAKLADLELRLHQPYWLLHQGECEHLIVISQIRYASTFSTFRLVLHAEFLSLSQDSHTQQTQQRAILFSSNVLRLRTQFVASAITLQQR